MSLVSFIDGRETFTDPNMSMEIRTFYYCTHSYPGYMAADYCEHRLSQLVGDLSLSHGQQPLERVAHDTWHANERNVLNGLWTKTVMRHNRDDLYFGIVITTRLGKSALPQQRVLFLQLDQNAPYNEIAIELTGHPQATTKRAYIEGRFNALTTDAVKEIFREVRGKKGLTIFNRATDTRNLLHDAGDIKYTLTEKEAGRKAVAVATKTVETSSGSARITVGRARRINTKR